MADLAIWITAAEPALGWTPGTFLRAYASNESEADARVVEAESLADAILKLIAQVREWKGTATTLLQDIHQSREYGDFQPRDLPGTAESVGLRLRRIAPNLRRRGIEVDFDRGCNNRLISIRKVSPAAVIAVTPDGEEERGDLVTVSGTSVATQRKPCTSGTMSLPSTCGSRPLSNLITARDLTTCKSRRGTHGSRAEREAARRLGPASPNPRRRAVHG